MLIGWESKAGILVWYSRPPAAQKSVQFGLQTTNWAGARVDVSSLGLRPAEPANMVFAEWKVPVIRTSPAEPGSQLVGFWVGLGGRAGVGGALERGPMRPMPLVEKPPLLPPRRRSA